MSKIDIVALIESNPLTKLSSSYNNKLLIKIKDSFTENQQQMFITSFYCWLNYHPLNDFIIDLDNIWQWIGFSQKDASKRLLEKNFILDKDYKSFHKKEEQKGRGGSNKETIMLNIKTFKLFCLKSGTKKAHEIHEYFIKLEEMLQDVIHEESQELKLQL
jgi:phage anti-repressor protein